MFNSKDKLGARIVGCKAHECSFNHGGNCRTIGINVGGPEPLCDTFIKAEKKGGILNAMAKVGACKVEACVNNKLLECGAEGISVVISNNQAFCGSYQKQS